MVMLSGGGAAEGIQGGDRSRSLCAGMILQEEGQMTDERFNDYQLKELGRCFDIVKEEIDLKYREKAEEMTAKLPKHGRPRHWDVMKEAIDNFDGVSKLIMKNELDKFPGTGWQEIMLLVEAIERGQRNEPEKTRLLTKGLICWWECSEAGFREKNGIPRIFAGPQWENPGERGISPMLMAIAEL